MTDVVVSPVGEALIQSFEGYMKRRPDGGCEAYLDTLVRPQLRSPGYQGLWTIGWGCTGRGITKGTVWSRKRAEQELSKMIARHAAAVSKAVHVPLTQNQADALISLSYNMGLGKAQTLLTRLNKGDYAGAADAFLLYNRAGGRVVNGLTRRRRAERTLFLTEGPPADVVKSSRRLRVVERMRKFLGGLGITAAAVSQFVSDSWQWVKDNPQTIAFVAVGFGAAMWMFLKWTEKMSINEYKEGRYRPSGNDV